MKTLSFSENCLGEEIEYQYSESSVIRLNSYKTTDNICCEWIAFNISEIAIIKGKTIDNNEDVIAVCIYYSKRLPYGKAGKYDASKMYHIYNGNVYSHRGIIKTVPKEVKKALKEINLKI
jgi:hypothetical protein